MYYNKTGNNRGCPLTLNDRLCLDGTLNVENSVTYMISER